MPTLRITLARGEPLSRRSARTTAAAPGLRFPTDPAPAEVEERDVTYCWDESPAALHYHAKASWPLRGAHKSGRATPALVARFLAALGVAGIYVRFHTLRRIA